MTTFLIKTYDNNLNFSGFWFSGLELEHYDLKQILKYTGV